MNRNPRPQVYFIRPVGQEGPIKVGHSHQVAQRLRELGKWSPVPLELVAAVDVPPSRWFNAGQRFERRFHLRYAAHRLHFEWFAPHPLILEDIERIGAGTFCTSCLPEWGRVPVKVAA